MESNGILDIWTTSWPIKDLKPIPEKTWQLYWKHFRRCRHNLDPGKCDIPDCIVRFVMFS
jgi:hypothetical protein